MTTQVQVIRGKGQAKAQDASPSPFSLAPRPLPLAPSSPSLRSRLVLVSIGASLVAFTAVGIIIFLSMRDALYREFDEALFARITALTALVEHEGPRVHVQQDPVLMSGYSATQRRNFFEIRAADGTVVERSASLRGQSLPAHPLPAPPGTVERLEITLPDGRPARVLAMPFIPRAGEEFPDPDKAVRRPVTILVASETRRIQDALFRFAKELALVCGGATLATAAALWWLITRQLRPVHAVADQIARVGRADLSERLDPGAVPTELLPVVARLNDMLDRLGDAFEREKSFTADVAHELRTPISALETALEVSASRPREPEAYRQTVGQCLHAARDMHTLVDRLLTLARADARQLKVHPEPVDVRALIQDAWDVVAVRADRRGISLDLDVPPAAAAPPLTTDRELLRLVVQNALDNAVSYAPTPSTLRVRLDPATPSAGPALHFLNPAPDLTPDQISRVFDRFWRADHARQSGHAGLGLPLVQRLMQAVGGSASVTLDGHPGLFHLTLRFPA